jgi:multicomponent Na+:H+ antiporter subunit D
VFHHAGIKIPYFAFFAHDCGIRCQEAPPHMLIAMGAAAFLCVGIGVFPEALYAILPYAVDYAPYTVTHVITQLQLLTFSALAFAVLIRTGIYPPELQSVNLDSDWLYRRVLPTAAKDLWEAVEHLHQRVIAAAQRPIRWVLDMLYRHHGPEGRLARTWPTGSMVLWVAVLLASCLIFYYV